MSCYHETDQSVISSNPLNESGKQLRKDGDMIRYQGRGNAKTLKKIPSHVYTAAEIYIVQPSQD